MFRKIALLMLAFAGMFFAGAYTEYCLDQTDPCFQANCYKVAGTWENNPDSGKNDCMYDLNAYTDADVSSAFSTCIAESDRCEQMMESGGSYSYSPSGQASGGSSSGGCCGSAFVLLSIFAGFGALKR
jgi:hypothetical protein